MIRIVLWMALVAIVGCAEPRQVAQDDAAPFIVVVPPCSEIPVTVAAPAASTAPFLPTTEEPWETVHDLAYASGTWVHHDNGDSHPGEEINEGGVRLTIRKHARRSRTPWGLRFWAPRAGHMTHDTITGGCGFYDEVHDDAWRTAFCKGYGLGQQSHELKLVLDRNYDGDKLRFRVGSIIDEVLSRPPPL